MLPAERGRLLYRLPGLVAAKPHGPGELDCRDNGKTLIENAYQGHFAANWLRYYAGLADKMEGAVPMPERPGFFGYSRYEPVGVVGMITPWDSPIMLLA